MKRLSEREVSIVRAVILWSDGCTDEEVKEQTGLELDLIHEIIDEFEK